MPRFRVRRKIEQETTVVADNERQAEELAQALGDLEWEDTGYVELEAEYDLRRPSPAACQPMPKERLN